MKKPVVPRIRPSQRPKKRYILFASKKPVPFERAKAMVKGLGVKGLFLVKFDFASGKGIVSCERSLAKAAAKELSSIGFETLKTSGSIKQLKSIVRF